MIAIITTIQKPTESVKMLCARLSVYNIPLIVIGDTKGPLNFDIKGTELVSLTDQNKLSFDLASILPPNHYARKNIGYLMAISREPESIYETDDDNAPNAIWTPRTESVSARRINANGWCNVYRLYSSENIWPRGFPLDRIKDNIPVEWEHLPLISLASAPIQQGLANRSPDVDAVWRLVLGGEFKFCGGPSVLLPRNTWCPFNSQTTWWWPSAYPLMYLPFHCPFRMTDIWRSFIAQRCLWEFAEGVVFHPAEVDQERNTHDLMKDFADEVSGYLKNTRIVEILGGLSLKAGPQSVTENLFKCYEALGFVFKPVEPVNRFVVIGKRYGSFHRSDEF